LRSATHQRPRRPNSLPFFSTIISEMDFIPDRLLRGIAGAKRVVPNPTGALAPTPTSILNSGKITHAVGKLGLAGVADEFASSVLGIGSSQTTIHSEKISHMVQKLSDAGLLKDDGTADAVQSAVQSAKTTATAVASHSSHGLATKWIIIIAVVVAVLGLALLSGAVLLYRRFKRRRAYGVVSRGIDKKGKGPMREKEDMFNADMGEADSFNTDGQRLTERNFESGYNNVDTSYEGTGYGGVEEPEHGGDKRARLEA